MIVRRLLLTIAVSAFSIVLMGCQDASDRSTGSAAPTDTTTAADIDRLEQDLDRALNAAGDDIAALEEQVKEAGASVQENVKQQLEEAKQERDSLRARIDELGQAQHEQTQEAQSELREARRSLNERLDALALRAARNQGAFVDAADERLDRLDQQFAELKRNARETGDEIEAGTQDNIEELEQRRDSLRADVQRAKQATSTEFAEMRSELTERIAATRSDAAAALDRLEERVETNPTSSSDSTTA